MCPAIEVSEDLKEEIEAHVADDESPEDFLTELLHHYEAEGHAMWEGYGGPP